MDPATLVGIVLAVITISMGGVMEGGNPGTWISPAGLILIIGGTFGATMASWTLPDLMSSITATIKGLTGKPESPDEAVKDLVMFAEIARRDGLLALEEAGRKVEDKFLRKGVELAVDGTDAEEIRDILESEIHAMKQRHSVGEKWWVNVGTYAPTVGICGAVLGLIAVMLNLSDPAAAGHGIAAAFTATLYGVAIANVIAFPIGGRLKRLSSLEVHHKEMILEGILSIQAGANPRVVEQKLLSYLPPKERAALQKEKAA